MAHIRILNIEYFTLGPPPPSHPSSSDDAGNTGREEEVPLHPDPRGAQQNVQFNCRATQSLPNNGRGVGALSVKVLDDSEPLRNGGDIW